MKSVEELQAIKNKMKGVVVPEQESDGIRIVVGMATCGIAAGARPVYEELKKATADLKNVQLIATGCVGICQYEPVVEVYQAGKERVTYVKMTAEKAAEVAEKHIKGGQPVAEYTIGYSQI